ncbi:ATP-binding protein [Desulfurispira natronophila]|uniref:ATP-binding protein n=1 Tax=Desulfurispira natronophila TaxID=682562 RepID=A0A7W7Y6B0_9BACT|nr:ATP-binding protein [Desulfurispira natronophila]MBB5022853.1 hypothetical protein [Desulfurispira natronophila]
MFKRSLNDIMHEALEVSPAVLVCGSRQVGKSTLCLSTGREYRVFDNLSDREAAHNDPAGYIRSLPRPVAIDEVQKVPQVLEGIKIDVDGNRINGNFLLTGSANVLDMKQARDTLAGRIIEIVMWPLSQKEIHHKPNENIIDVLFQGQVDDFTQTDVAYGEILKAIIAGGYPEILKISSARGRSLWFDSYISTYIERDIRDIGELRDVSSFIRFYNIIAPRSGSLLNKSNLACDANISEQTASNYLSMLEMIYQASLLQPYSSNISKRFIKSPKLFMTDSGILSHLVGISTPDELLASNYKGNIIETFVYSELLKHISYSQSKPQISHYRTSDRKEIDFIIEKGDRIFAIEVKSSQAITKEAFKHIAGFQRKSPKDIVGIVFYGGDTILPFGDEQHQRYALPMNLFF